MTNVSSANRRVLLAAVIGLLLGVLGHFLWMLPWARASSQPTQPMLTPIEAAAAIGRHLQAPLDQESKEFDKLCAELASGDSRGTETAVHTRPDQGASSRDKDDEWDSFPRTTRSFARHMVYGTDVAGYDDYHQLYRNADLNPRDVYIPKDIRRTLPMLCGELLGLIHKARTLMDSTALKEGSALVAAGLAHSASMTAAMDDRTPEELAHDKLVEAQMLASGVAGPIQHVRATKMFGKAPYFMHRDGDKMFGVHTSEMPLTKQIEDAQSYAISQAANAILAWFETQGTIRRTEAEDLLEKVFSLLESR